MSDYTEGKKFLQKPEVFIKNITFNDGNTFEFNRSDIVVFTGANNTGKSQVLKDIVQRFKGKDVSLLKVISNHEATYIGDIEFLMKAEKRYSNGAYQVGNAQAQGNVFTHGWKNKDLSNFASCFIGILDTEHRLSSSNKQPSFDSINQFPANPIQYLFSDDEKESDISNYFYQAFGVDLIVDRGAGNTIPLFVGMKPKIDRNIEDRISKSYRQRLNALPQLQNQGDGMRSFAAILLDTFTTQHTITLVDEPEAFLHPPQARLLGMMLSKHTPNTRQLFIATHSEDFLKGLLDAGNENVKIIRIDRIENTNRMNILIDDDIKQFWKDPLLRYSNILSGLFHHKVVICESDSDCRFYQAVMNSLYDEKGTISPDILFTHCGGKQRVKTIVPALKSLNVKTITIVDIDVLNDKDVLREIINSYRIKWDDIKSDWNIIDDYVKSQRPQLNKDDVVREITSIFKSIPQSETVFPKSGVEKINRIVKQATAWAKIKETGKVFFSGASYTSFEKIDRICREKGLFIVPVGELEGFYKPITNHGPKWVNSVLETANLKNDLHLSDAHDFVRAIVEY